MQKWEYKVLVCDSPNFITAWNNMKEVRLPVRINERWRICFEWLDNDAYNWASVPPG